MWNEGWDDLFDQHSWGRYAPLELVRTVFRNFSDVEDRTAIRFLEVGCGPGANLWFLTREGFSAHGLDGSKVALEQAKQRLENEGLKAELHQGDAMVLPFPDVHFDAVIDIECLYANTKTDTRTILAEIHRVLKQGGFFFSMTFMTGLPGGGTPIEGEPNTFTDYTGGPLHEGYGVVRLTAEEDIPDLYSIFDSVEYDHVIRSDRNRETEIREWLIFCRK
jgi:SAM-dependent methyltransferase